MFAMLLKIMPPGTAVAQSPCDFTWTAASGTDIQFQNTYTGGNIIYEKWSFGDGNFTADVSNPRHTYYYYCFYPHFPTRNYTVRHEVTVLLEGVVTTYVCEQVITVQCNEGSTCTDRYFTYIIRGCSVTLNPSLAGTANLTITWDFGDGTPPVTEVAPTHSYAQPGTYLITQTYSVGGVSGTCSRWVTVGCCCESFKDLDAEMVFACGALLINAVPKCEQEGRYRRWILQVGNRPPVVIPPAGLQCWQLTNFSTYQNEQVKISRYVWCDSMQQEVVKTLTPPREGIFIGISDPPEGCGCVGTGGCLPPITNISDYLQALSSLSAGAAHNRPVYVSGIIRINQDFAFHNARIYIGPRGGFDVPHNPGNPRHLQISDGSQIATPSDNCCLWRGIWVYGNGRLTLSSPPDAGYPRNRVKDALYAVRGFNIGGQRPRLFIRDTEFHNNLIGIRATDGDVNLVIQNSNQPDQPMFERNIFSSQAPLECFGLECLDDILPSLGLQYSKEIGLAGMWLSGQPGQPNTLTSINLERTLDGNHNLFNNLALGIWARDINLRVPDGAAFRNITSNNPYGLGHGINYLDNTGAYSLYVKGLVTNGTNNYNDDAFFNCEIGVRAQGNNLSPTLVTIEDCRMRNMVTGVYLDGFYGNLRGFVRRDSIIAKDAGILLFDMLPQVMRQFRITNNKVALDQLGIGIGVYSNALNLASAIEIDHNIISKAGHTGILANFHRNIYIHDNTITGVGNTSQGIGAYDGHYEIECNSIGGSAEVGISIWNSAIRNDMSFNTVSGSVVGIRFDYDCPAENLIRCNTMQNISGRGLLYYDAFTGYQNNTGNRWLATGGAEFIIAGNYTPDMSRYRVPDQQTWKPEIVIPGTGWFQNDAPSIPICQKVCQPGLLPPGGGEGNAFDEGIATGALAGEGWDQWRRERYLLYKLASYPELADSSSAMAAFQQSRANSTVGQLTNIGLQAMALFSISPADQATLAANQEAIAEHIEEMAAIDGWLNDSLEVSVYDSLYALRTTLNAEVVALVAQNTAILSQHQANRSASADTLLAGLNAIHTTHPWEVNEKQVLTIFLQTVAKRQWPDAAQLSTLQYIGEQCPITGGPAAVFLAAMLYEGFTGERLVQDECETTPRSTEPDRMLESTRGDFTMSVYPNPVYDRIMLDIVGGHPPYSLRMLDILGREVFRQDYNTTTPVLYIPEVPRNIYLIQVIDSSGFKSQQRLIVKH